jgi:hypothetical protein
MQDKTVLRKNPNMVTRVIDDETILLPIFRSSDELSCIYTLNEVGSKIWEKINGKNTLSSIKKKLLQEFNSTAEEVDKKLEGFLKELKEIKAIK